MSSAEWITIPVPALVDAAVFDAAQAQLQDNRQRARIPLKGSRYLLQGVIVCARCGYTHSGRTTDARNAYYRCSASDAYRCGGTRLCRNTEIRMDVVDQAVWQEVCQVLQEPTRLADEYRRRLLSAPAPEEREQVATQLRKLQRGIARLIDSYADGLIDRAEFEPRVRRLRDRLHQLEADAWRLHEEEEVEREVRVLVGRLEQFAAQVHRGLQHADWQMRRELIRTLVKRVEIDEHQVRVVFRLSPIAPARPFEGAPHDLQHCGERVHAGRFHGHLLHLQGVEPIVERQQVGGHGREGPRLPPDAAVRLAEQHAGHACLLMPIQPTASRRHDLHRRFSLLGSTASGGCGWTD